MKGLNLDIKDMPSFIDIEASGLHFDSYPIEIAVILDDKMHSWLIRPEAKWRYWSDEAQALHGISRSMLEERGMPAIEVAIELNQLLSADNGLVYSDACAWDEDWLNILFHTTGQIREFHILAIDDLLDESEQVTFQNALREVQESGRFRRHRAAPDVMMICEAYRMVKNGVD